MRLFIQSISSWTVQIYSQSVSEGENTHPDRSLWIQHHVVVTPGLLKPHLGSLHAAERNHQDLHRPSLEDSLQRDDKEEAD